MTLETEMIFLIQQACAFSGGTKLGVERHAHYAQKLTSDILAQFNINKSLETADIEKQINDLVKIKDKTGRKIKSHEGYAKMLAPQLAEILKKGLDKT